MALITTMRVLLLHLVLLWLLVTWPIVTTPSGAKLLTVTTKVSQLLGDIPQQFSRDQPTEGEKYRFRVLLDENNSFGVLGNSGKGITELYGVPIEKVDIITAAMGHSLAAEGGFYVGSIRVTAHQRLSTSGYVFSTSLPPYLPTAAITAIDVLEENPELIMKLNKNIDVLCEGLFYFHSLLIYIRVLGTRRRES
ncbi:hypothetical protein HYC85_025670 [Camellia sinensis]|uniref:serine C-palmitoyltransferase n=1 Tax=Camellia sinensis TaxID=4442 RepID=A0A7J7GFJ3_CAMSI|nr:hypothetical protein HYC85_025670 [Camellia sinensis]